MKDGTKIFSELRANQSLSCICGKLCLKSLADWAALFGKLKNLNLKLQGKVNTSSSFATNPQAFYSKLQNWHPKVLQ